jgi:hypothetical protein
MNNEENEDTQETTEITLWQEGDQTHGARGVNVKGLNGCIRVKGCRELGGIEVAIFETDVAYPHRSAKGKWTVKVVGLGDNGPMFNTKTRKEAMKAARYPSVWSPKCAKIVEKIAQAKVDAEEAKAQAAEDNAEVVAEPVDA